MAKIETLVFHNPGARRKVLEAARKIQGSGIFNTGDISEYKEVLRRGPSKVAVFGGEGTLDIAIQGIYDSQSNHDSLPEVGIYPGGTQNVLWNETRQRRQTMLSSDFVVMPAGELAENIPFKPAFVGGKAVINQYDTGLFAVTNGRLNEELREFPIFRPTAVRVLAAFKASREQGRKMDLLSVTRHIGKVDAFCDLDTFGEEIAKATIESDRDVQKLLLTLLFWAAKLPPPRGSLKIEKADSFEIESDNNEAWINGDTQANPIRGRGKVVVARAGQAVNITALF